MEWKEIQKRQSVPEKRKKYIMLWQRAQFETWNRGSGYYYWSYKLLTDTVNTPGWIGWDSWDLGRSVDFGWIVMEWIQGGKI